MKILVEILMQLLVEHLVKLSKELLFLGSIEVICAFIKVTIKVHTGQHRCSWLSVTFFDYMAALSKPRQKPSWLRQSITVLSVKQKEQNKRLV